MAKLIFSSTHDEATLSDGSSCAEICEQHGIPFACTEGICGTCIVPVESGMENLSAPTQAEIDFLGADGVKSERMMCQCKIQKGAVKIRN